MTTFYPASPRTLPIGAHLLTGDRGLEGMDQPAQIALIRANRPIADGSRRETRRFPRQRTLGGGCPILSAPNLHAGAPLISGRETSPLDDLS
jgi:hypothetical protein